LKGKAPNEANIKAYLNNDADVAWPSAGLSTSTSIVAPSVGKVRGKTHYYHIIAANGDGTFKVFDPNGGRHVNQPASYFEYCYK
jgi:hypothetical protein